MVKKIGVIGAGVWGTGLSLTAARAGCEVLAWAMEEEVVHSINETHVNKMYMPEIPLPDTIHATTNIKEVMAFADVILVTSAAQYTRSVIETIKNDVRPETILVLCAKGIEVTTGSLLSEVVKEILPDTKVVILSGPGFAYEVARQKPTAVTLACEDLETAQNLVEFIGTKYFRPYSTNDIISPQIGGSVKNVMAIASGIVEGAGLGDNARAALITRGLTEMIRLSKALGGYPQTMMGMSGLGDLVLTANATQSRNFSFGYEVGKAGAAAEVLAHNKKTVEGILTTTAVLKRAKALGIDMPICETVQAVLFDGLPLTKAMEELLSRPFKDEGF